MSKAFYVKTPCGYQNYGDALTKPYKGKTELELLAIIANQNPVDPILVQILVNANCPWVYRSANQIKDHLKKVKADQLTGQIKDHLRGLK